MKLIFVYNANSGRLNALFDAGHKLLKPSTYPCSLCHLTFDAFSENLKWKAFRQESDKEMEFYHKDEFESKFPNVNVLYPSVLKLEGNAISTVLNNEVLDKIIDVEALIEKLKSTL